MKYTLDIAFFYSYITMALLNEDIFSQIKILVFRKSVETLLFHG